MYIHSWWEGVKEMKEKQQAYIEIYFLKNVYCECDQALEWVVQRSCRASILGHIQTASDIVLNSLL